MMKMAVLNLAIVSFSLFLFTNGFLYFTNSIKAGAVEKEIERLSTLNKEANLDYEIKFSSPSIASKQTLAYELNSYASLLLWTEYLEYGKASNEDALFFLEQSLYLRPTWSHTSNHLYRIMSSHSNFERAGEYLVFAQRFGPYVLETMLINVDYTFTYWLSSNDEERLRASRQLLALFESSVHRSAFNQMIHYSPGKQRICNLLKFNRLSVKACK